MLCVIPIPEGSRLWTWKQIDLIPSTVSPEIHHCLQPQHDFISQRLFYLIFTPILWGRYDLLWVRKLKLRNVKWLNSLILGEQTYIGSRTAALPLISVLWGLCNPLSGSRSGLCLQEIIVWWEKRDTAHLSNQIGVRKQMKTVAKAHICLALSKHFVRV